MHKTFSIDNMETYFRNYVPCSEHGHQPITNFCTERVCLKFMCPDCVERHSKTHANHPVLLIVSIRFNPLKPASKRHR